MGWFSKIFGGLAKAIQKAAAPSLTARAEAAAANYQRQVQETQKRIEEIKLNPAFSRVPIEDEKLQRVSGEVDGVQSTARSGFTRRPKKSLLIRGIGLPGSD